MDKLIVLDFATGEVNIYNIKPEQTAEDLLDEWGHKEGECEWMQVKELSLTIHRNA